MAGKMTSSLLHKVMGNYPRRNCTHASFTYVAGKHLTRERKMFVEYRKIFVRMNYNFLDLTCQPVGHHTLPVGCSQLRNMGIK